MPIKINISERTIIEDDFIETLIEMWKERWTALNNEVLQAQPSMRSFHATKNAPPMNMLKAQIQGGKAFDFQKTQLMCLPFVKFSTVIHNGDKWLFGLTKPIVLTDSGIHRWQGPRYTICVPRDVVQKGTSAKFHWVPQGYEMTYARHPHHNASRGDAKHPLDMYPNTCWGEFPTIVSSCVRSGDIVNLFRVLHLYTTRVNMRSLLTNPFSQCEQFTPLPDVYAAPEPVIKKKARR